MKNIRRLLNLGSQTAPKVIDDAVRVADDVAERGLVKKVFKPDEILGEAAARRSPLEDFIDAEILNKANPDRMNPNLAKLIGAGGLGAGAVYLGSQMGEDEPEMQPEAKTIEQPPIDIPEEEIEDIVPDIKPEEVAPVVKQDEVIPYQKKANPLEAYMNQLDNAQGRDIQDRFMAGMLRAGTTIGSALGQTKADYSGVEALEKNIGSNERNVKSQMAAQSDIQKMGQAQNQIDDEELLRDPNSGASKAVRNVLSKFGVNVKSAQEAKNLGINIQNILLQEMASTDRMKIAEMKAVEKEAKDIAKLSKDKQDNIFKLRKNLTEGNIGKQYNNAASIGRIADALQMFADNPSAYGDYGSLLISLKGLQGDDSVIRGEEMKLGMNATSFTNKLLNYIDRVNSGKTLQPEQRKDMLDSIKRLRSATISGYKKAITPILEQARDMDIDEKYLLPVELRASGETVESGYSPREEAGIQAVMDRNGVSREQAISALKKANKLK